MNNIYAVLTVIFVLAKIGGERFPNPVVDWSWWLVLWPLWALWLISIISYREVRREMRRR